MTMSAERLQDIGDELFEEFGAGLPAYGFSQRCPWWLKALVAHCPDHFLIDGADTDLPLARLIKPLDADAQHPCGEQRANGPECCTRPAGHTRWEPHGVEGTFWDKNGDPFKVSR